MAVLGTTEAQSSGALPPDQASLVSAHSSLVTHWHNSLPCTGRCLKAVPEEFIVRIEGVSTDAAAESLAAEQSSPVEVSQPHVDVVSL